MNRRAMNIAKTWIVVSLAFSLAASAATAAEAPITNPSANTPDRVAWELFVEVNSSLAAGSNVVFWETWAAQDYIYAYPCVPPHWPGEVVQEHPLRPSGLLRLLNRQNAFETSGFDANNFEETRLNRVAFDYIANKGLWYQEGVIAAAAADGIDFPPGSKVLKANWIPIAESDKARYHWVIYEGKLLGLNAFHLVDKSLPRWLWSTFEHVDNEGRCDAIGCKDNFGVDPAYVAPHVEPGLAYPPGKLEPALEAMFKAAGIDPVFRNYRLKGTMVDFTDAQGRPELLGSSVLEPGFTSTSSCMTCHARASVSTNTTGKSSSLAVVQSLQPLQGFVGVPDPAWFGINTGKPLREAPIVYRTDFLWELAGTKSNAECPKRSH